MRPNPLILLIGSLWAGSLMAGEAPTSELVRQPQSERPLQEVLVNADHAGPALWKVRSGQHLLWILAEPLTPLSTKVVWRQRQVQAVLAGAQEVILDGGITFDSRRSARQISAATYQDMRSIPGPQTSLMDVVSPGLYRRFEALKEAFAASYASLEQLRPWAAGFELSKHVTRALGLSDTTVRDTVVRLGWRAQVITLYTYADYLQFQRNTTSSRTQSCLEEIVSELEVDRDDLQRLERAWSVGDIEVLREAALRQKPDTCTQDMFDNEAQASYALAQHTAQWLNAIDLALKSNETTFALVPASRMFAPDGWLSALRARGYEVQEPH